MKVGPATIAVWFTRAALLILFVVLLLRLSNEYIVSSSTASSPKHHDETPSIDQWRAAFFRPEILHSSPLGSVLAPAHKALDRIQNPSSCRSSSFFIYDYRQKLGFGAIIKHMTVGFYHSLLSGRVFLISDRVPFHWARGCTTGYGERHECYFRSLSNCSQHELRKLIKQGMLRMYDVDAHWSRNRAGVPIIPKADPTVPSVVIFRQSAHNEPWVHSLGYNYDARDVIRSIVGKNLSAEQESHITPIRNARRTLQIALATYITRLNEMTALKTGKAITKVLSRYGLTLRDHARVVGVPIRRSDKCFKNRYDERGEMKCIDTVTAIETARRVALAHPSITHILLTSEDLSAIATGVELRGEGKFIHLNVMRNFLDLPTLSGDSGMRRDKTKAELLDAMLVTLHLQAFPSYHVLTPRSTFHSLINCYAQAFPGKLKDYFFPLGSFSDLPTIYIKQLMR